MNARVKQAKAAHQAACEALMDACKREYPIGTVVTIEDGRGAVDVRITCHSGCWWSRPSELTGRNVLTGKERRFDVSQIVSGGER